ncbi:MAG: hypothetical protein HRU03_02620 [Nanoarchaeales archaeon]|nr:hypothetical protein [Nanoarchaeales archaeon]
MYILKSLAEGLRILGFDRPTIRTVSREKDLEEIFLSTLFLNYIIVLFVYLIGIIMGGYSIGDRALNMEVFFGLLMVYPFIFNLKVYLIYGFFGITAELLNAKNHVRPLISVGFHTAIVYSIIILIICALSLAVGFQLGAILFGVFFAYFLYTMFVSISTIYKFSFGQSLTVLMIPFLVIGIVLTIIGAINPNFIESIFLVFLA